MPKHHNRDRAASGPSQRQLRVGELIRHALAEMLSRGDIHDPVIEAHMITVPEVAMTPDLRLATIYVMPLGGRDAKPVIEALERNCLLYTSDAADERSSVDLGGRRIIKKKKNT